MRIPVRTKLIITYLLISVFTSLFIYLLTYFTSEPRISELAQQYQMREMKKEIQNWWAAEHHWEGFQAYFKELHPPPERIGKPPPNNALKQNAPNNNASGQSKTHGLLTADRVALMRYLGYEPGDVVPKAFLANATPIRYKGEIIAWIIPPDATGISLNSELKVYLDNTREIMMFAIAVSILLSLIMALVLARFIIKPVESLTKATSAIAHGNLEQTVPEFTNDEIGDLSRSFNKMSQDLAVADKQRRQLTADITHDLGTPVQVISGYIEMARDGELELNQDRIETISDELVHIQRLLKDMSLLAETDAKTLSLHLMKMDISSTLERVVRNHKQPCADNQINLVLKCDDELPMPDLDEERIVQVLGNLINNAIRYTPVNGEIEVSANKQDNQLIIQVADNGTGIQPEDLPYIFDRFYRSDSARSGKSGKMGLGLSISKGLVEMQGGTIHAESDGQSGSLFKIIFPV